MGACLGPSCSTPRPTGTDRTPRFSDRGDGRSPNRHATRELLPEETGSESTDDPWATRLPAAAKPHR